ncbi:hypothetical protein [Streptomyces yangpuensis]|uniref:hypothetical protein n=1 Tax=Streptomyces yangpuensis TaxID=1648182 RepID=UPI00371E3F36
MCDQWTRRLCALAVDGAAPADVLPQLLGHEDECARRPVPRRAVLPQEVVEAVPVHPDHQVRIAFAQNAEADPEQQARLPGTRNATGGRAGNPGE